VKQNTIMCSGLHNVLHNKKTTVFEYNYNNKKYQMTRYDVTVSVYRSQTIAQWARLAHVSYAYHMRIF